MRKICAITANRADFSRLESVLLAIRERSDLDLQLVVMGSHLLAAKGKTIDEIKKMGFAVYRELDIEVPGGTPLAMTQSVGQAIIQSSTVFDELRPNLVIVPVDRFESLAMGTAAALMNFPIAHIQGGEVTGTIDESIRHALTKLSHLHFVSTDQSRQRVIKMGEPAELVFNVGCPATDLLLKAPQRSLHDIIEMLNCRFSDNQTLDAQRPYLLVIQHPVTSEFEAARSQIQATLDALERIGMQYIILWPNIDAGGDAISAVIAEKARQSARLRVLAHIPSALFASVLRHAACLVGNSSSGIREACYFGTPVVNIGSRQRGRERGSNVVDVACDADAIGNAIRHQLAHGKYPVEPIFGDGTAGRQIASILAEIPVPSTQKRITY